jgi:hypothetical protein
MERSSAVGGTSSARPEDRPRVLLAFYYRDHWCQYHIGSHTGYVLTAVCLHCRQPPEVGLRAGLVPHVCHMRVRPDVLWTRHLHLLWKLLPTGNMRTGTFHAGG